MTHEELKQLDRQYVIQTYGRFDVDIDHGQGATLYSLDGREYIDFTSGIGVCSIGYGNPRWAAAVAEQAARLAHVSNLFYTRPYVELARTLCQRSGMAAAFFGNSGAEGNEGLIKLARKYSFDKYGKGRGTILTLKNSFHGRTMATLTATGQEKLHSAFHPFPDGFRYAEAGSLDDLQAVSGHDVCAVLLELVQGEGGVYPMPKEYVHDLAVLCAERDWLLLVDQQYGILPDAVSFAKGIAGGLPMGGFLVSEKCREVLGPGDHGSTFGGNPICAAAAQVVLDTLDEDVLAGVTAKGAYLRSAIEAMDLPCLGATRGMGLMLGVEVRAPYTNKELAARLIQNGLLVLTAGDALRLLPPLTISQAELDRGLDILKQTLS